ncbi:hypothetical protein JAK53_13195 [Stenotrophomonas maltophilia]|jgi:hypothetical protein|uniref:Uncharacterized protein n=1 Tax=Stenotrophomonas maltophilia TaxID=40324 RepID=A0AAJ3ZXQ0_STEMA|nr:hypothetical protein [Stenotrophomonas maltophilia]MCU1030231.1 hypothetical protein [Stenotrophomonas maltophilia]QDY47396.1 hypothetical protein DUW70_01970 [Stenotrophomonas maltophilia]QDY50425.1 hypothetical protein DUW70_18835 [Stenotrophomonas maltophilia]QQQ40926.1 hypothetical protein JJL50_13275 [Stenotrophomonas maltophilia]
MEEDYLRDLRALMLSARAREIRDNTQIATNPNDLEVIMFAGEERQVLTFEAALRYAITELRDAQALIEQYSGY